MTNLNKHESAAEEAKDAHDAASLATLAAAFDRLVSILEIQADAPKENSLAGPVTSPVADDGPFPIVQADAPIETSLAGPVTSPVADDVLVTLQSAVESGPVAEDDATDGGSSTNATTVTPQPAIAPVAVVAPIPVITPDELAEQLADVESVNGKWFLVTQGLEPGIYPSWTEASPQVTGVSKCSHTKQSSKAAALSQYTTAWKKGGVIRRT